MSKETKEFDAEVGKVLNLMIHSLYTDKEIFMRELISNASDACDKLRYLSQTNSDLISGDSELKIKVSVDKDNRIIKIRDNGIGMDKQDLIDNLGTIARSGTQAFAQSLSGDAKKDSVLIGQFGVGFYSIFMVADEVIVTSRKAGDNNSYVWRSYGDGKYTVEENNDKDFTRGTEIEIKVKSEEDSYLDHFRLKHIIKSYSDHIVVPVYFIDEQGNENKVNSSSALWTRSKSEITDEQYQEFYKNVAYSADKPWMILHNKNEGATEFTNLLFIPTNKTFDLFHPDRKRRVKLYIKRVFITDEGIDLIPHYLRFLRGIIDCEDLPLNISRQTLQHNALLAKIRSSITKRVLNELEKKKNDERESYISFWTNFGSALKEGLCEATSDHEKLLNVCMFQSTLEDKLISLDEYIAKCKDEQKTIYYLSGDDINKLKTSPQVEGFTSRGIDVLLFTDHVDDFWVNVNNKYKDYDIKSVTRSDIDLENLSNSQDQDEQNKKDDDNNEQLIKYFKDVLGSLVSDVKISKKLTSSPACLAVGDNAMDMRMERFLIEQKQLQSATAKILELNSKHPIILKIIHDIKNHKNDNSDLAKIIFDQACIIEGENVTDPKGFAERLNNILQKTI